MPWTLYGEAARGLFDEGGKVSTYSRQSPSLQRSTASYRFRRDLAQINDHFWMGMMGEGAILAEAKLLPPQADPVNAMTLPPIFQGHVGHAMAGIPARVKSGANWRRLATVVLLGSALERYVKDVSATAIASDPIQQRGFPKHLDGLLLQKHGLVAPSLDLLPLVKGTWEQRMKSFASYFHADPLPPDLQAQLDRLRRTRNDIAHNFGFGDYGSGKLDFAVRTLLEGRGVLGGVESARVNEKQVAAFMAQVQQAVDLIDSFLMLQYIGDYEPALIYILWKRDPDGFEKTVGVNLKGNKLSHEDRFQNVLARVFDYGFGTTYTRTLQTFVDKI